MKLRLMVGAAMMSFVAAQAHAQTQAAETQSPATANGAADTASPDSGEVKLDEIIVTAQKRAQNLQNVPVSVSAVTGEKLADQNLQRLEDLAVQIPAFAITQDPIGDKINIRGIQSGNNAGLEQSVPTFVDGVYHGRGVQSRFAFLDLQRVEVLRGPQGTLFGKNTVGGAISLITAKPTRDLDAALDLTYTFDNIQEYEAVGHVSGPITDGVRARLAARYYDLDKGYIRNSFYNTRDPNLREYAVRGTVEADVGDEGLLTTRVEYGKFDLNSQPFGVITPGPFALFGVRSSYTSANIGSINPVLNIGSSGTNNGKTFEIASTYEQKIGAGTLTLIGGYSRYNFLRKLDADFGPVDLVRFDDGERFKQTSFEARYASDTGNTIDYIAGAFYQNATLNATGDTEFNVRGSGNEIAIDTLLNAGCQLAKAAGANPATDRNCILNGLVTAFDGTPLAFADFGRLHFLDQKSKLFAVFGEMTWNISDEFAVTGGVRYANEKKRGRQYAYPVNFGTKVRNDFFASPLYANFGAPNPFAALGEAVPHDNRLGITENDFTGSLNFQYKPNRDTLLYLKGATGAKAGGFNSFAFSPDPDEATYKGEKVKGVELGGKFTLLDRRANFNIAAFYSKFSDIQTAVFTGSTSFIVDNASSASTKGIEIESRFAVTRNLQLRAAGAYVDFSFNSYPFAGCTVVQLLAYRVRTANPLASTQTCSLAGVNNLKGRTSENTPKWSGSIGLDHKFNLGSLQVRTLIDLVHQSSQYRQSDLDPALLSPAYTKVDLSVNVGPQDGWWQFAFIAKNLFNERTFSYGNDAPLVDGARQFIPDQPRTIGVRLRLKTR